MAITILMKMEIDLIVFKEVFSKRFTIVFELSTGTVASSVNSCSMVLV